jgi:hypothetical protein
VHQHYQQEDLKEDPDRAVLKEAHVQVVRDHQLPQMEVCYQ